MTLATTMPQLLALAAVAAVLGALLGHGVVRRPGTAHSVVQRIDALLPQTQCGRCSYAGCLPYAQAIAAGEADINRCPPGGDATIQALADLLGREPQALAAEVGPARAPQVAWIDEARCIGCARCIPACPVDAIVGTQKRAHTVIAAHCTGCELCLPPCPVDCIELRAIERDDAQRWRTA